MKYLSEPKSKQLQRVLDQLEQSYREQYARHCQIEEIVDVFKNVMLWRSSLGRIEYSVNPNPIHYPDLYIQTYEYPIDLVIDSFCGIIHKTFQVDWKMENASGLLQLKTTIFEPFDFDFKLDITIHVYEGFHKTCELVKIPRGVHKEASHMLYDYKINCGNETIAA